MWHSWLHHIRQLPPHEDKALQQMTPSWMTSPRENITGTRGAFKTYSTTKPKVVSYPARTFPPHTLTWVGNPRPLCSSLTLVLRSPSLSADGLWYRRHGNPRSPRGDDSIQQPVTSSFDLLVSHAQLCNLHFHLISWFSIRILRPHLSSAMDSTNTTFMWIRS
jgi:hypothetical protein